MEGVTGLLLLASSDCHQSRWLPLASPVQDSSSVRSDEQPDCPGVMVDQATRARQFIYEELVATETDYLRDLKAVIQVRCSAVT